MSRRLESPLATRSEGSCATCEAAIPGTQGLGSPAAKGLSFPGILQEGSAAVDEDPLRGTPWAGSFPANQDSLPAARWDGSAVASEASAPHEPNHLTCSYPTSYTPQKARVIAERKMTQLTQMTLFFRPAAKHENGKDLIPLQKANVKSLRRTE